MTVFVGGLAAAFLGLLGIIIWHHAVLKIILGAIPLILLVGGLIAAYLGYDEVKDKLPFCKTCGTTEPTSDTTLKEEAEKYKQEAERLKEELDKSKTS
ncbi:MAG: hypothetical protein ABSF90_31255 [Syntrophobacteraceae bacterium]|jgi:uncharacterized protein involved in cysteine biosynthesis